MIAKYKYTSGYESVSTVCLCAYTYCCSAVYMSHHEMYHGVVSFIITGDKVDEHSLRDAFYFKSEKAKHYNWESSRSRCNSSALTPEKYYNKCLV